MLNKRKNLLEQSKVIIQLQKLLVNSNILDKKSVTIEHPKTYRKLSNHIRQVKKVSQVSGAGKKSDSL